MQLPRSAVALGAATAFAAAASQQHSATVHAESITDMLKPMLGVVGVGIGIGTAVASWRSNSGGGTTTSVDEHLLVHTHLAEGTKIMMLLRCK